MKNPEIQCSLLKNSVQDARRGVILDGPWTRNTNSKNNDLASARRASKNGETIHASRPLDRKRKVSKHEATASDEQVQADLRKKLTELATLYPATYGSWRNMMYHRTKTEGAQVAPRWQSFKHFLSDLGSCQHESLTLDRNDPGNPTYGPGLADWRDKKEQARNRRTTKRVPDPITGEVATLPKIAERHGVKADTARRRLREGRAIVDPALAVIAPPPAISEPDADPKKRWPWPLTAEGRKTWEELYRKYKREFDNGYEYRFEFALRYARVQAHGYRERANLLRRRWADEEEPSLEEWNRDGEAITRSEHYAQRVDDAEAVYPTWLAEASRCRRTAVLA